MIFYDGSPDRAAARDDLASVYVAPVQMRSPKKKKKMCKAHSGQERSLETPGR